jgi:transcriptional regulator with GAF, ATPase, and Fis domain
MQKRIDEIPGEAMNALSGLSWPGNIRELQNFIERSVIHHAGRGPAGSYLQDVETDERGSRRLERRGRSVGDETLHLILPHAATGNLTFQKKFLG